MDDSTTRNRNHRPTATLADKGIADLRRRASHRASETGDTPFISDRPPDVQRAALVMWDFLRVGVRSFSAASAPAAHALSEAGLAVFKPGGPGRIHVRPRSRLKPRKGVRS